MMMTSCRDSHDYNLFEISNTTNSTTSTGIASTTTRTDTPSSVATLQNISTIYNSNNNNNNSGSNNLSQNNNDQTKAPNTKVQNYIDNRGKDSIQDQVLIIPFKHGEDRIYRAYFRREQRHLLLVIVFMTVSHAVTLIVLDTVPDNAWNEDRLYRVVVTLTLTLLVLILYGVQRIPKVTDKIKEMAAVLAWFLLGCQMLYGCTTTTPHHVTSDGLSWVALLTFATQVMLPVGIWRATMAGVLLIGSHCTMAALRGHGGPDLSLQIVSNGLIALSCIVIGLSVSLFMDRLLRKSFLETKAVLNSKAKIEAAYQEKKSLLLSVLPSHVAEEMIRDVGELSDGQFRKIYMSRYENVSILFADIVGFTAISSSVTAADLVQILNQLFGRFDVLANRYHQDRIKILGDCYYCVCGALTPRPDHAVLCIHMGLAVVDTIRFVRQKTGKDVNMRVGVHTGACLGGVLGQRQWQFDVLGKEVTLANRMESGGIPARVHISETTKACLNDEFELEAGHGGDREEELRLKNVTTYLVKAVLKPYPQGTLDDDTTKTGTETTVHPPQDIKRITNTTSTTTNTNIAAAAANITTTSTTTTSPPKSITTISSNATTTTTKFNKPPSSSSSSSSSFTRANSENLTTTTTPTTSTTTNNILVSTADPIASTLTTPPSTTPELSSQTPKTTKMTTTTNSNLKQQDQNVQVQKQYHPQKQKTENIKNIISNQQRSQSVKTPHHSHNGARGTSKKNGIHRNSKTRTTIAVTSGHCLRDRIYRRGSSDGCSGDEEKEGGEGEEEEEETNGLCDLEEDSRVRLGRGGSDGPSIVEMDLQRALEEKDGNRTLGGQIMQITMSFSDLSMETRYKYRTQSYSGLPFVALCLSFFLVTGARFIILPRSPLALTSYVFGQLILILMSIVSLSATYTKKFPEAIVRFAVSVEHHRVTRMFWGVSACAVFFLCDVIPIAECETTPMNNTVTSASNLPLNTQDSLCRYVIYYSHTTTLTLFAVASLVNVGHVVKVLVLELFALVKCLLYLVVADGAFDNYDTVVYPWPQEYTRTKHRLVAEVLVITLVLAVYDRKMELLFRKLFLWKEESKREKEKAIGLQRKNEALVFNLLPNHVAKDFIGARLSKRGLYSKAYDETGVIFAACPNFHAFYNESAVNNNGLECLRFLNEIISDYDELLTQARFASIVKIKTVGPTYMAVSGMSMTVTEPGRKPLDFTARWSHLNDLVQFAFGLQDVLRKINEQSFNNFILRIGVNHGPLIAGVIGATKPHYDVWGNTVNVASRMESTGQPGRIQVVEETKTILARFGYNFESRGLISVKGKGQLATYFLEKGTGAGSDEVMPNQVPDM